MILGARPRITETVKQLLRKRIDQQLAEAARNGRENKLLSAGAQQIRSVFAIPINIRGRAPKII
jgi:hypothetical protein